MALCDNCKDSIATEKHHIRYFPEETVPICHECHILIHKRWYDYLTSKYIKFSPGDSSQFYKQKSRIDNFLSYLSKKKKRGRRKNKIH